MADDKKIKELESLIAKLEKLTKTKYDLNIDTSNIKQVNSQINVLNRAIKDAEKEVASLDNTFNGLNKEIKGIVDEMGNWGTATSKATKAFKNIENITRQLKYDEKGLSELSKKDLERLQKQLKINKDELIEAAKLVKKKTRKFRYRTRIN
jgi:flagellar biosynthesis chaperone FliJ